MVPFLMLPDTLGENERGILERIFTAYYPKVMALAVKLAHSTADAEDLAGAVFENVVRYREAFLHADDKEICRLLVIYTRSAWFNLCKRKKRIRFESYDALDPDPPEGSPPYPPQTDEESDSVLEAILRAETVRILRQSIALLGEPQASVFYLTYYAGHTSAEVGEILHLNSSTVRTILERNRKKLKKELEKYLNDTND